MGLWLLVFCVMTMGFWIYDKSKNIYVLSPDAKDGAYQMPTGIAMEELERQADESTIRIQINARPEVSSGTSTCNLMIGNPVENQGNLKINVTLDATGEDIFQSEELKPGERIPYVTLNVVPKPGEHPATATFTVVSKEGGEPIGAVDAGLLLVVYE